MSRLLVALSEGGIMEALSDGAPPYTDVRLLDCQNGEAGDVYEFDENWRWLLNEYFHGAIPQWVNIVPMSAQEQSVFVLDKLRNESNEHLLVQQLQRRVASDIAQLRRVAQEPFSVPITDDGSVSIELRPCSEDNRVTVGCKFMGDTVVQYTDDGLTVDVFAADESILEPVQSIWVDANDLMAQNPNDSVREQ